MKKIKLYITLISVACVLVPLQATEKEDNNQLLASETGIDTVSVWSDRPQKLPYTVKSRVLSVGNIRLKDTYLSNIEYFGWNVGWESSFTGFLGTCIYWRSINMFTYGNTVNLPATSTMSYIGGEVSLGAGYNYKQNNLDLKIGGLPALAFGLKNNARNINNIQSVDASLNLWLDLEASYKIPVNRVKIAFTDHFQTSLLGGMFVPEFGALYYEYIFGSLDGSLHFSSFHNKVAFKNRLEFSLALKPLIIKVQYYINYQSWRANSLYFAHLQHNFGLGIVFLLENKTKLY
ncbi:MAG: hypothetical protein Q4A56_07945 [Porphyromonadaceae bacterium]|nr:hypothetical protein [Porphyromonadaceae bacterium]